MRRVEVVLRGEHLVLRAQRETRVEEAEAHRRRVRQRDFGRRRAQEAARRLPRRGAQSVTGAVQVLDGVRVEPLPVGGDRVRHRPRVRGEQEGGEMDPAAVELELRADRAPIAEIGRRIACLGELGPADGERARREARPRQEPAASQFGHAGKLDVSARTSERTAEAVAPALAAANHGTDVRRPLGDVSGSQTETTPPTAHERP